VREGVEWLEIIGRFSLCGGTWSTHDWTPTQPADAPSLIIASRSKPSLTLAHRLRSLIRAVRFMHIVEGVAVDQCERGGRAA